MAAKMVNYKNIKSKIEKMSDFKEIKNSSEKPTETLPVNLYCEEVDGSIYYVSYDIYYKWSVSWSFKGETTDRSRMSAKKSMKNQTECMNFLQDLIDEKNGVVREKPKRNTKKSNSEEETEEDTKGEESVVTEPDNTEE